MAGEITVLNRVTLAKGSHKARFDPGVVQITQTGVGGHSPVVSVGTSEEDLSLGDITTPGLVCLLNLDTANFVKYGPKSGSDMVEFGRLKPGEPTTLRLGPSGVTLRWIADTAPCKIQVMALEN